MMATVAVITIAVFFGVTHMEAIALVFAVALVWISEMLNTTIEKAMNVVTKDFHPGIKIVKDLSAGSVLVAAIAAFLVGSIIFIPKILILLK